MTVIPPTSGGIEMAWVWLVEVISRNTKLFQLSFYRLCLMKVMHLAVSPCLLTQSIDDLAFTHHSFYSDIDCVASLDEKQTVSMYCIYII